MNSISKYSVTDACFDFFFLWGRIGFDLMVYRNEMRLVVPKSDFFFIGVHLVSSYFD